MANSALSSSLASGSSRSAAARDRAANFRAQSVRDTPCRSFTETSRQRSAVRLPRATGQPRSPRSLALRPTRRVNRIRAANATGTRGQARMQGPHTECSGNDRKIEVKRKRVAGEEELGDGGIRKKKTKK